MEGTISVGFGFPVLKKLNSSQTEAVYIAHFSGKEFYLEDHVIKGQKVLPAVVQLEMTRIAVEDIISSMKEESDVAFTIKNMIFIRPIVVNSGITVSIRIQISAQHMMHFKIQPEAFMECIHSQGEVHVVNTREAPSVDLKELKKQCNLKEYTSSDYYPVEAFRCMDLHLGGRLLATDTVYLGSGQVLARLKIPESVQGTVQHYIINPSLVDSALQLQTTLALWDCMHDNAGSSGEYKIPMPFSFSEVKIYGRCETVMWAWNRDSRNTVVNDDVKKYDIDLCDENGKVCVQIFGCVSRFLGGNYILETSDATEKMEKSHKVVKEKQLRPVWEIAEIDVSENKNDTQGGVMILGGTKESRKILKEIYPEAKEIAYSKSDSIESLIAKMKSSERYSIIYWIGMHESVVEIDSEENITRQEQTVFYIFKLIKALLSLGYAQTNISMTCITFNGIAIDASHRIELSQAGIYGLVGSLANEYPNWKIRVIDLWNDAQWPVDIITDTEADWKGEVKAFRGGKWYCQRFVENKFVTTSNGKYRKNGVYVVIGGAGGIGTVWSEFMIREYNAQIVWIGRRSEDDAIRANIKRLQNIGPAPLYICADARDRESLEKAYSLTKQRYEMIHGVVISAIVLQDQCIEKMDEKTFRIGYTTKADIGVRVAQVFKNEAIDFVLFFSSINSYLKSAGQSNYVAGCVFMDAYAHELDVDRNCMAKTINWGYWGSVGVVSSKKYQDIMERKGFGSIEPEEGMEILRKLVNSDIKQISFYKLKDTDYMSNELLQLDNLASYGADKRREGKQVNLYSNIISLCKNKIKELFAKELQVPVEEINTAETMEKYGIDSIIAVSLRNKLQDMFGPLNSTILFEYQTINALAEYLVSGKSIEVNSYFSKYISINDQNGIASIKYRKESIGMDVGAHERGQARFRLLEGNDYRTFDNSKVNIIRNDVAIIGMAGKYPQADGLEQFWKNLVAGRNCITEIPPDRWDWKRYYSKNRNRMNTMYTKWGGFLDDIYRFDSGFFHITPSDAEKMDPQERLFLEIAYQCIEDAGYTTKNISDSKKVGIFVGVGHGYYPTGANFWSIANRISYLFDFHGPSMSVDTACSSSLTAIHLAYESILHKGCDVAIAGGVNLIYDPRHLMQFTELNMLSESDTCKVFGENADGFIDSEGVGAVVLKLLEKAIADGDHIYGVIKSSKLNAGGKTNGYTVPNPNAQASLVEDAIKDAGISARSVSYIEAHGTGTSLGDPIEVTGLSKAFAKYTTDKQFCAIGSVKANIGHCECAAGIASVTKVLLQIIHKQLVPSINAEKLNPEIDFCMSPFYIVRENAQWEHPAAGNMNNEVGKRIAGVSSFGAGGANAHLIIEEHTSHEAHMHTHDSIEMPAVILISARDDKSLNGKVKQFVQFIDSNTPRDSDLHHIAFTLQVGREHMAERLVIMSRSLNELKSAMENYLLGNIDSETVFRGRVDSQNGIRRIFSSDSDLQETIAMWVAKKKYAKLIELWLQGVDFDWRPLYDGMRMHRVSLPLYPFAGDRYVMSKSDVVTDEFIHGLNENTNLLIHQNISTLTNQIFRSIFTGKEYYISGVRRRGNTFFPDFAYIEMARDATFKSLELPRAKDEITCISQVSWGRPVAINSDLIEMRTELFSDGTSEVRYEITYAMNDDSDRLVANMGTIKSVQNGKSETLDIQNSITNSMFHLDTRQRIYQVIDSFGIHCSDECQLINDIYSDGSRKHAARISMTGAIISEKLECMVHPSILDTVVQALYYIECTHGRTQSVIVPQRLSSLKLYEKTTRAAWMIIEYSDPAEENAAEIVLNANMYDNSGELLLHIEGLVFEKLESSDHSSSIVDNSALLKDKRELKKRVLEEIKSLLAEITKYDPKSIDPLKYLENYGIDSVIITKINQKIAIYFHEYSSTLFFEYGTIDAVSDYLVTCHQAECIDWLNKGNRNGSDSQSSRKHFIPNDSKKSVMRLKNVSRNSIKEDPIAIIGISGRYPQANSIEEFWENIALGLDCITEVPENRWSLHNNFVQNPDDAVSKNKSYCKWGGFLDNFDSFDSLFFNISPTEAQGMDPQERIFLEECWKLIEDAGYTREKLKSKHNGKIGVFAGITNAGFSLYRSEAENSGSSIIPITSFSGLSNRVSYFFDFHGPSMSIDTMCSSSLTAVHEACNSILQGNCVAAIAGGGESLSSPK